MKSPTLRKCLDYRVCNDEISAQIQKVNKAHIYCNTVKCSSELTWVNKNKNKKINAVKQIHVNQSASLLQSWSGQRSSSTTQQSSPEASLCSHTWLKCFASWVWTGDKCVRPIGNWVGRFEGQCFPGEPSVLNDEIWVLQKCDLNFYMSENNGIVIV